MLTLTKKIKFAMRHYGFESVFVIGPQGCGKTTYAMLVAYEIYRDWDKVLHYVVFDPLEIMDEIEQSLEKNQRIPLIVFDDAGVHLSKYLFHTSEGFKLAIAMNALFNLMRTVCAGVIFTSPDMDTLKEIRKKAWIVVEPQKVPGSKYSVERKAVIYRKRILASGYTCVKRIGEDYYRLDSIPCWVRAEYEEKRKKATKPVIVLTKQALRKVRSKHA